MPTVELTREEIESLIRCLKATSQGVEKVIRDAELFKTATPPMLEFLKGDFACGSSVAVSTKRRRVVLGKLEAALGAGE